MNREFNNSDNNNERDWYPDGEQYLHFLFINLKNVDLPVCMDTGDPSTSRSLRSKGKEKAKDEDLEGIRN
jgi:hypothetical protein